MKCFKKAILIIMDLCAWCECVHSRKNCVQIANVTICMERVGHTMVQSYSKVMEYKEDIP